MRKYTFAPVQWRVLGRMRGSPPQPTRECGELAKLSQWGLERSPAAKAFW